MILLWWVVAVFRVFFFFLALGGFKTVRKKATACLASFATVTSSTLFQQAITQLTEPLVDGSASEDQVRMKRERERRVVLYYLPLWRQKDGERKCCCVVVGSVLGGDCPWLCSYGAFLG